MTAGNLAALADVVDAMEDQAEPGKDAVVLADVRGELPIRWFSLRDRGVFVKFVANFQRSGVECQRYVGGYNARPAAGVRADAGSWPRNRTRPFREGRRRPRPGAMIGMNRCSSPSSSPASASVRIGPGWIIRRSTRTGYAICSAPARDAVDGLRAAVVCLKPERAILLGAARARIFVHRVEPAAQFVVFQQHAVGTVLEDLLRRFNRGVEDHGPKLLGLLGFLLLVLRQPQPVIHSRLIIARHFVIDAPQWLGGRLDRWRLHGRGVADLQHPEPGGFLPFAVIPLRLKLDAVRDRTSADRQGADR